MSDQSFAEITDAQWADAARASGLAPQEFKKRYVDAVSRDDVLAADAGEVRLGQEETLERCKTQPFECSIWKIIGLKGTLKLCGPESDWSLVADLHWMVAGVDVANVSYTLSKRKAEVSEKIELFVFRAGYKFGIRPDGWCVYIGGTAGYWKGKWNDHKFDKTLFCFDDIL